MKFINLFFFSMLMVSIVTTIALVLPALLLYCFSETLCIFTKQIGLFCLFMFLMSLGGLKIHLTDAQAKEMKKAGVKGK